MNELRLPPERDLPPGRLETRHAHLVREVGQSRPAPRRTLSTVAVAFPLAALVAVLGALLVRQGDETAPATNPSTLDPTTSVLHVTTRTELDGKLTSISERWAAPGSPQRIRDITHAVAPGAGVVEEVEHLDRVPVAKFDGATGTTWPIKGPYLPDAYSALDELLTEQRGVTEGRSTHEGTTEINGIRVEKHVAKPDPSAFGQSTVYLDPTTGYPVVMELRYSENEQQRMSRTSYDIEFLPPTPENLALASIAAQHPDARRTSGYEGAKLTAQEVASGMEAGSMVWVGTDPRCVEQVDGSFRCQLTSLPTRGGATNQMTGAKFILLNPESQVAGGCIGQDVNGRDWICHLGQAAVDAEILDALMLGTVAPGPGSG